MSAPNIPPRPQRAQAGPTALQNETPSIPPRPARKADPSPGREASTRSPLNAPPFAMANGGRRASQDNARSSSDLPRRPPSVSLPSIGQEGEEYSSYDQLPAEVHGAGASAELTKSVSPDLPMHQPRASMTTAAAKKQIQTVTRTDSTQAAAAGIGKSQPADDVHKASGGDAGLSRTASRTNDLQPPCSKPSFSRSTSNLQSAERTTSRPGSVHGGASDYEHGIPTLGQQVPLLAYAGDVQAPSPVPGQTQHTPGIGFFNDGTPRNHHRKRSSRHELPDIYGLRHSYDTQDKFEKDWIAKHPQEAAKEEHYLHLPKPETALSSEQLNRLVHQTRDVGFGTSPNVIGTPDEEIAFNASQEYITRNSPQPSPALSAQHTKRLSSGSHPPLDPSFRRTSLSGNDARRQDQAMESEDDTSYHLNPPPRKHNKVTGGGEVDNKLNLGYTGEDGGYISEHAVSTPILASDEIIKRPGSAYMHAAIEPSMDRNADDHYESDHGQWPSSRRNSAKPSSRPSSRPGSVHGGMGDYQGGPLHRFVSHEEHGHSGMGTPLEEIEEYEPLFPEDEKDGQEQPKKVWKKRPELAQHHFPSQDIWEDTPDSLQYSATVSTPDLERSRETADSAGAASSAGFETPEQEQARRAQNPEDMTSSNKTFVKPHFKPSVLDDVHRGRPGVQRFPSSDVWEDSPDSFNLTTTVGGPQADNSELRSPPDDAPGRPTIPARPEKRSRLAEEVRPEDEDAPSTKAKPSIPARPARGSHSAERRDSSSVTDDNAQVTSPPAVKPKPAVPARPAGSKIAALQSGFMNDLNNRLKLGPQGPPAAKKEVDTEAAEESEKAPLADARKGRAKGPPRRAAQKSAAPPETAKSGWGFAMSPLITVWTIDEEDEVVVQPEAPRELAQVPREEEEATEAEAQQVSEPQAATHKDLERVLAANEDRNTRSPGPPASAAVDDGESAALPTHAIGHVGDTPEPTLSPAVAQEQKAVQPEFEAALAGAAAAPRSAEERELGGAARAERTGLATVAADGNEGVGAERQV